MNAPLRLCLLARLRLVLLRPSCVWILLLLEVLLLLQLMFCVHLLLSSKLCLSLQRLPELGLGLCFQRLMRLLEGPWERVLLL